MKVFMFIIMLCFGAQVSAITYDSVNEEELIKSIIFHESRNNPFVVNKKTGAVGLMQILPSTAKWIWEIKKPKNIIDLMIKKMFKYINTKYLLFIPHINVYTGKLVLNWLRIYYKNDLEEVLIGYNAGMKKDKALRELIRKEYALTVLARMPSMKNIAFNE